MTPSHILGMIILICSFFVKIPQIVRIFVNKSVESLSFLMFYMEAFVHGFSFVYGARMNYVFTAYGENLFLFIWTDVILAMFIFIKRDQRLASYYFVLNAMVVSMLSPYFEIYYVTMAEAATLPISIASKIPQIWKNYVSKNTGVLDHWMIIASAIGCAIRIYTTHIDVNGDFWMTTGFVIGLILNLVLLYQIFKYSPRQDEFIKLEENDINLDQL